mgnify:CR=1 FL=1
MILLKDEKTNYLETLTYQLIKRRIAFSKKEDEDIYQTLKETTMDSYMFDFIHQLLIPLTDQRVKLDNTKLNKNQKNILKQILSDYQKYVVEKKYIDDEVLNQRIAKSISRKTYTIFLDIDDIILENHSLILLKKYPNHFLLKNQISLSIKYSKYLQEQKWLYCPDTYLSQRELAMITEQFLKENIKKINEMILKDEKEIKVFFYQAPSSVAKNKSLMQLLGRMIEKYRAVDYLIAVDKESDQKKLIQDQAFFKKDKQTIVYQEQEYCCENIFKTKKTYPIVILPYLMEDTMEAIFNPRKNTYERKMILSASLTVAQKEIWIICSQEREEEIKPLLYSFHKVTYFLEV